MFELTKEVERLQQQIEGLGHNSQAREQVFIAEHECELQGRTWKA